MKTNWRKPLSFLLALCLIVGLFPTLAVLAEAATIDVFEVEVDGVVYTNRAKNGGTYTNGVRPIRAAAGMTEVVLPSTITCAATEGGTAKTWDVIVPDGALSINSPSLKVLDMSRLDNLQQMGLQDCTNLTKVILPRRLKYLTELPLDYFKGCTSLTEVVFPENLTILDTGCFQDCTSLKSIELPDSLTEIRSGCFSGCTSLTSVVLPEGLTKLGSNCFQDCTSLKSIELPDSLNLDPDWSYGCFRGCTSLTSVALPKCLTTIPSSFFYGCTSLTSVSIPNTVTLVDDSAFYDSGLTTITLPEGLKTLGQACFYGTPMTDLKIPAGVTTLGAIFTSYGGTTKAAEGLKVTFMGDPNSIIARIGAIPSSVTVYLQPGTERPSWLYEGQVLEVGKEREEYKLSVSRVKDGKLDLGTFTIQNGSVSSTWFALENQGSKTLNNLKIQSSAKNGRFTDPQPTLAAGSATRVDYYPNSDLQSGSYTETLTITADGLSPITYTVNFTVTATQCITVEQDVLDFGTIYKGDQPKARTVTIKNTGDHTVTLVVRSQPNHFTCTFGQEELAPGGSTTVTIQPKQAGTYEETARFACGSHSGSVAVDLQLTMKSKPSFSFGPAEIDFGTMKQGHYPAPQPVSVANEGNSLAAITKMTLSGDAFEFDLPLPNFSEEHGFQMYSGSSFERFVAIKTKSDLKPGTYTGALEFEIEDGTKHTIPLKFVVAEGTNSLSADPGRVNFDTETVGYTQPNPQTVTLKNTGTTPVTLLQAPTSSYFILGALSRTTLAAGQSATFTVQPKAGLEAASYGESLSFTTAQGDDVVVAVNFAVKGANVLSATPDSLDFGSVTENYTQPGAKTVTIKNTGSTQVTLQAPTSSNYTLGSLSRTTLAAGQTATFTVQPKAGLKAGSYSEKITVKTSQAASVEIAVSFKVDKKPVFVDVPDWCTDSVDWAVSKGVTVGTGGNQFSPYRTCTHVEILTFLWRAADEPSAKAKAPFTVASYFQDAVDWAYGEGMIGASFNAMADCTRADAVKYIWQAFGKQTAPASRFTDVPANANYAMAVNWAVSIGVTVGTEDGTTFSPSKTCGRGEIVTFLHRAYVPSARLKPASTPTQTPSTPSTPSGTTAEQMCARVVELVNQERAKQGLSPLSTMASLTDAANIRAPELVTKFSHDRPDGSSCFTALREANVTGYYTMGENIASGYSTPEAVMNGWMNSPGHKANILNANFTHIGVAYYNGRWVQMFVGVR